MNRPLLTAVAILTCAAASPDSFARCGPSRFTVHGVKPPETVTLNGPFRNAGDAPVFYIQYKFKTTFMAYVRPEDLVRTLEKFGATAGGKAKEGSEHLSPQPLYDELTRDLPIKQDTDLHGYTLRNIQFSGWIDAVVTDLMTTGNVGIDIWPYRDHHFNASSDAQDPKSITIVPVYDGETLRNRYFCTPDDRMLLDHWYVIY